MQNIIIAGAGPVGLFCALELASYKKYSLVLDSILNNPAPWSNSRTIALSYGSMQLLRKLNIDFTNVQIQPIKHVHISNHGKWGSSEMFAKDYKVEALGYTIGYSDLCNCLYKAAKNNQYISFKPYKLQQHEYDEKNDRVICKANDEEYITPILIISEGAKVDNPNDKQYKIYPNNQYAHVGWVKIDNIPAKYKHTTFERFTNQGPLALLPYKHNDYNYAIVWCNFGSDNLLTIENLQDTISYRIGKINQLVITQKFNLIQQKRLLLHTNNVVYIGNSAQSLHPVAAQGLNLGFRQAHVLVDTVINNQTLSAYAYNIAKDRESMLFTTYLMSNIFTKNIPLLGLSLNLIDILPSVKTKFARHFMFGRR